jgi:hypothetical protein
MWIYFLERENKKVVVLSDRMLLDATKETQEELEKFNIRYTLTYTYIEDLEYAKQVWRKGGYRIVDIGWLTETVKGWYCEIEEKPKVQPPPRYEGIFSKRKRRKPKRNTEWENETRSQISNFAKIAIFDKDGTPTPEGFKALEETGNKNLPKPPKPLPHQKWVWSEKNFAEGTVEMIIEEVIRRGLFVEFLTSKLGQELTSYYGEALRDLVRKKIREL